MPSKPNPPQHPTKNPGNPAMLPRCALLCLALAISPLAQTELTIEITQGLDRPTPIAAVPFFWQGAGRPPLDFAAIIRADLRRSGLFDPMPESNMLSFPHPGTPISFRDWRITDTQYLLTGTAQTTPAGLQATIELHAVSTGKRLFRQTLRAAHGQERDLAHRAANQVYKAVTGIPGIFHTRIGYITDSTMMDGSKRYRLMLADQDGARERLLFESTQPLMSPTWSPDGQQLAYVSFETGRPAIFTQNLTTGTRTQLTNFPGINSAPAYSPDGRKLAMSLSKDGNPEIYVLDLATRTLKRITKHFAIDTEPNWTADGQSLVFTSDRGGRPQIYQVHLKTRKVRRLTFAGDYNARPRLSRDGRYLVMVHRQAGRYHIAVQDLQDDRLIIATETALDESPTIAPNGAIVMYATNWQGRGVLAAVSLDAGVKYLLPARSGDVREPAWSPN